MAPARKTVDRSRFDEPDIAAVQGGAKTDKPQAAEQDWESLAGAMPATEIQPGDGDAGEGIESTVQPGLESSGELPGEEDDNPYQDSDEALPDDDEERAIRRTMAGRGTRYKPQD